MEPRKIHCNHCDEVIHDEEQAVVDTDSHGNPLAFFCTQKCAQEYWPEHREIGGEG